MPQLQACFIFKKAILYLKKLLFIGYLNKFPRGWAVDIPKTSGLMYNKR
ncbi:hypothetical protein HMPREF6123_2608 [Oribacterium sinus F0268]|uniref:Uncharacterized protein n=1 Tax=Oribacterium sinus F0268 TaxID=585501 RepID=C2L1I9_9FIRM|nr:hypothetical protein HMPREF6123_2608 [Oribacterium sinus F0268]